MSPKIQILIGMIASGKSTYAAAAAAKGYLIVNDDNVVSMLHGGNYRLYDEKLKPLYKSVESHIAHMALAIGRPVVIDRGVNVSERSRRRWIAIAKAMDVPCEAVVMPLSQPEAHAVRRYNSDARGHILDYWVGVAKKHASRYNDPIMDEGFDEIYYITEKELFSREVF